MLSAVVGTVISSHAMAYVLLVSGEINNHLPDYSSFYSILKKMATGKGWILCEFFILYFLFRKKWYIINEIVIFSQRSYP
jgi:hypothetical protein